MICAPADLEEFADRRDIQLLYFLLHHVRGKRRHTRKRSQHGRNVHGRIAHRSHLQVVQTLVGDGIETKKRKEEGGLNTFHPGAVGHNQTGVDAFQRAA
jgi:hypothetical protein